MVNFQIQSSRRNVTANAVSGKSKKKKKKKFIDVKIHRKLITRAIFAKSILQQIL